MPALLHQRSNGLGVVLIGAATEGAQPDLHAITNAPPLTFTSRAGGWTGRYIWKALPCPSPGLWTQMRPPCASITSLQKARPSPELRVRGMFGFFTRSNFRKISS